MKRILLVFALISMYAAVSSAQQKAAVIACVDSAVYDFGTIKEADGPATHVFVIKNVGEAPLAITNVVPSCGCTTPSWSKEPVLPGKTTDIKVSYKTEGSSGPFIKTISIYSSAQTATFILTIKGVVIPKAK
jgi:hypothetical protein